MAEPTTTNTLVLVGGAIGTLTAANNSAIAHSLLSANFEQLITLQFHFQMGDFVSIIGVTLLIWNTIRSHKDNQRPKR